MSENTILLFITAAAIIIVGGDDIEISMLARPHQAWEYWCFPGLLRVNVYLNFKLKLITTQLS